jgi:hypothetical protein
VSPYGERTLLDDKATPSNSDAGSGGSTRTVQAGFFSLEETVNIAKLINGLGVFGSQLIKLHSPDVRRKALALLQSVKQEHEGLLKRLDRLARASGDESALRVIEDTSGALADIAGELTLAKRCFAACAFLGHCIATFGPLQTSPKQPELAKRQLH